jgi:hypothetical protein
MSVQESIGEVAKSHRNLSANAGSFLVPWHGGDFGTRMHREHQIAVHFLTSMPVDQFGNPRWLECLAEDGVECVRKKIDQWPIGGSGIILLSRPAQLSARPLPGSSIAIPVPTG